MKKKNKYLMLFLGAFITTLFCGIQNVSASTLNFDFSGYYYERGGNGSTYSSWKLENYYVDGNPAFCIEPGIDEGTHYGEVSWDQVPLDNAVKEKIMLIGYYGYQYTNHQTLGYRAATQGLMWEAILGNGSYVKYSTERYGGGTRLDDSYERSVIQNLMAHHYDKPSMNGQSYTAQVGKPIVIEDTNHVLDNYDVYGTNDAEITIENNTLTIIPTKIGKVDIRFVRKQIYSRNYLVYYAEGYQNMFTGGNVDPVVFSVKINGLGGKVEFQKQDSVNQNNTPQGEATLEGAVYGIYDQADNLIQTIITDKNGYAISDYLPAFQQFYLKEISPSQGYQLDTNKYLFESSKDKLLTYVKGFEDVITRDFDFTKVYATDKTQIMTPEVGVEFGIYDHNNNLYAKKVTDKNGKIFITLPYGRYTLRQLTSTSNYEKIEDYVFEVKDLGEEINKVFSNAEITAKLKVVKIDAESQKPIKKSNIKFKIFDITRNQYVCQTITYPTSQKLCEFQTDNEGVLITPYPLSSGKYRLEEIDQKIDKYLWNSISKDFEIGENSELINSGDYGIIFETKFENKQVKGEVEIIKLGEKLVIENGSYHYEEIKLDGVTYELYANEDIYSGDGTLIYHKGDLINSYITKDGYLKISGLFLGKYYLLEKTTLSDHVLDTTKHEFELKYIDQYTPIVSLNFTLKNYMKKGTLDFSKTDLSTGNPIPNTLIEIRNELDELLFVGRTDKYGKIIITNLPTNMKLYILEKETADDSYILNTEKIFFEIMEDGEIIKATMSNEKIVEVPNTGIQDSKILNIIGIVFILIGVGYIIYDKNKKK